MTRKKSGPNMSEESRVPPYSPSPPSPRYSTELLPGERTVEQARGVSTLSPVGVYRRITDSLTIVLRDQHPGSIHPTYRQNAVVRGDLILKDTGNLTSVVLKLKGSLHVEKSGVSVTATLFSTTYPMWSALEPGHCPRTIPFAIPFPSTFKDGDATRHPPPSFESREPRSACSYSLSVELLRPRQYLSFLKGSDEVNIPLLYRPRSRPPTPMLPSDLPFMSTVKSSPEEWHQILCTMNTSETSGLAPLQCLLFIPSAQIFAFSDIIPFHLQIRGPPSSLIPFLEQDQASVSSRQSRFGMSIRVFLLRQTGVKIHDQAATSSLVLCEGKLEPSWAASARHHAFRHHPLGDGLDSLDWDGEVQCSEDVTVASFVTSQLSVKDFIVLSITPRQALKSPLISVRHSHQIKLVTDPWSDQVASW